MKFKKQFKAFMILMLIICCNLIQTHKVILENSKFHKKALKNEKNQNSLKKFNRNQSSKTKVLISSDRTKSLAKKTKTKSKLFSLIFLIVVISAVLIKSASIIIDHAFLYPSQKENLNKLNQLQKEFYTLRSESCTVSKIRAVQNRAILFAFRLRFIPFNYGSILEDDNCICKLGDTKHYESIENEKCKTRCEFIYGMMQSIKKTLIQYEENARKYDETSDQRCGWEGSTEAEENVSKLKSQYEELVSNQSSLLDDIASSVSIVTSAVSGFLGTKGITLMLDKSVKKMILDPNLTNGIVGTITKNDKIISNIKTGQYKNFFDKSTLSIITTITEWISAILNYVNTNAVLFPESIFGKVTTLIQALIDLVTSILGFLQIQNYSAYMILHYIANFAQNLRDIGNAIFSFVDSLAKFSAMFTSAMDLIISTLRLARSALGLVEVKNDLKLVDKLKILANEEKKVSVKQICEDEREIMKTAIDSKTNIDNLQLFKYKEDHSTDDKLKAEIEAACLNNINLCERTGEVNGEDIQNILSLNKDMNSWAKDRGPISDIVISYNSQYDFDFERLGFVKNPVNGKSDLWNKNVYICRACNTNIILSICLTDKDKAFDNSNDCKKNTILNTNERFLVVHLSYKQSLVLKVVDIAKGSGNNISFVDNFNLNLRSENDDPIFILQSFSNRYSLSYSNGSFNITTPNSFPVSNSKEKVYLDEELLYVMNEFCVDNCSGQLANEKNKCLNINDNIKHHMFLEISKHQNNSLAVRSSLLNEYNKLCSNCLVTNGPKNKCATFYEVSFYQGKSFDYCTDIKNLREEKHNFYSAKIDDRYYVQVFSEVNFKGNSLNLQGNVKYIKQKNLNFHSIKICKKLNDECSNNNLPLNGCVTFFENDQYKGKVWTYCESNPRVGVRNNNSFSSVLIDDAYQVIAYESYNYVGERFKIAENLNFLKDFNDKISSFKLCSKLYDDCPDNEDNNQRCVRFFDETFYKGKSYFYCYDQMRLRSGENNSYSSLIVSPGFMIVAYEKKNYRGQMVIFDSNKPFLEKLDNSISSFKICPKKNITC